MHTDSINHTHIHTWDRARYAYDKRSGLYSHAHTHTDSIKHPHTHTWNRARYASDNPSGLYSRSWARIWKTYGENSAMSIASTVWNGGKRSVSKLVVMAGFDPHADLCVCVRV